MASGTRSKRARTGLADPPAALPGSSPLHLDRYAATAAHVRGSRDWASLTSGPAGLIPERVLSGDVADYVRFRAVCTAWRACTADLRAQGAADRRFHPRRWIMLPSTFNVDKRRRFLNVSTGQCIFVGIPDLRRYYFLGPTAEGLLVLCRKGTHIVQLLNPLTGQVNDLPCATSLLELDTNNSSWRNTAKAISHLPFRCAGLADDSTVVLIAGFSTSAVAKPGDERWTRLRFHLDDHWIMTAFPFGGRLYCATRKNILVVDTVVSKQPRLAVVAGCQLEGGDDEWSFLLHRMYPPVHDDHGDLILVYWCPERGSKRYTAYRVNFDTGKVVPTGELGGQTLFVSWDRLQSVPARVSSSISADTIYECSHDDNDRPKVVAFDLLGTRSELNFDN